MKMTPAQYVINTIGGVRKTARAIGRTPGAVSKWHAKDRNGGIPRGAHKNILAYARSKRLDITAEHLVLGCEMPGKAKRA